MDDFIKRMDDLSRRSETRSIVTHSGFLTPAECYEAERAFRDVYLFGGGEDCERKMAFFLPDYMTAEDFDAGEYIAAVKIETKFAHPSHRDFMGSILGLGITRETVGDITVYDDTAYAFMQTQAASFAALNLERVGRFGAKTTIVSLSDVPKREIKKQAVSFSVMSLRLDAVCAGMFNLSRTTGAKLVEGGFVTVNYRECIKPDREIEVGDIISVKGHGKGVVTDKGGTSRRGRTFIEAEIYK